MDQQIVFRDILILQDRDLARLTKRQVLDLCTAVTDLSDRIDAFAFLTTRFIRRLSNEDVDYIFKLYGPTLERSLNTEGISGKKVLDMLTIALHSIAGTLDIPKNLAVYKDVFQTVFTVLIKATSEIHGDFNAVAHLQQVVLSLAMCKKHDLEMGREVLSRAIELSENLLRIDQRLHLITWKFIFKFMDLNINISLESGTYFTQTFRHLSETITATKSGTPLSPTEQSIIQLHFCGLIKLLQMRRSSSFLISPMHLITTSDALDKLLQAHPPDVEYWSHLKGIIMKLLNFSSPTEMFAELAKVPSEVSFPFCVNIMDQFLESPELVEGSGVALFTFITQALMVDKKLVSTTKNLLILIARSSTVLHTVSDTNVDLFYKMIGVLVQGTINSKSFNSLSFRFAVGVQNTIILLLPQKSVHTAFHFYIRIFERLSRSATTPARWAFFNMIRSIYRTMSSKYQRLTIGEISPEKLEVISSADWSLTSRIAGIIGTFLDQLPRNKPDYQRLFRAMYSFGRSNHKLSAQEIESLKPKLNRLWLKLVSLDQSRTGYPWIGEFIHLLIRVTLKIDENLLVRHLNHLKLKELPRSSRTLILLAVLDADTVPSSKSTITTLVENIIRKLEDCDVKTFIFAIHLANPKLKILDKLLDRNQTMKPAHFPHERCSLVVSPSNVAGLSPGTKTMRSSITSNLKQALAELEDMRQQNRKLSKAEKQEINILVKRITGIISDV